MTTIRRHIGLPVARVLRPAVNVAIMPIVSQNQESAC
jgi:hypothetical protein